MSKVTIDKGKILSFLKLITLKNDLENKEALVSIDNGVISTLLVSSDRTLAIQGEMKLPGWEDTVDFGFNYLPDIVQAVASMDDEIKVELVKNKFEISGKRTKISFALQASDYVVNKLDPEKFSKIMSLTKDGIVLNLTQSVLKEITEKFNIVDSADLTFTSKKGKLYMYVKNYQNETELTHDLEVATKADFEFKVGRQFIDLISSIEHDVVLSFAEKDANAVCISFSSEHYQFRYLLQLIQTEAPETNNTESRKTAKAKKDTANV